MLSDYTMAGSSSSKVEGHKNVKRLEGAGQTAGADVIGRMGGIIGKKMHFS